ncbi:hypothetical protein SUGI_0132240 [Cryptomeria japonica]|nr:hypothetical protein SUGI_0132240 [Cryptomeria japonica]
MPRQKDFAWTHCTPIAGSTKVKCNWCLNDISGGIYHFKWHLAKEPGNNTTICLRCPADVTYQAKQALDGICESKAKKVRTEVEIGSSSIDVRRNHLGEEDGEQGGFRESGSAPSSTACGPNTCGGNINDFFQTCTTLGSHTTLESTGWRENVHEQAKKAIANFLFSSLPFHSTRPPYWQGMVDAIAAAGPGFQAPSYETLKVDRLKDAVQDVQDVVKEHRLRWAISGLLWQVERFSNQLNGGALLVTNAKIIGGWRYAF